MSFLQPVTLLLLAGAALSFLLEGLGAGVGERKQSPRLHQSLLVAAMGLAAALMGVADSVSAGAPSASLPRLLTVGGALVAFAACHGGGLLGERGALALALGAGATVVDDSLMTAFAFAGLWTVAGAGVAVRAGRDDAVEAAAKHAFVGAAATAILGLGILFPATGPGKAAIIVGLAMVVGLWPVHGPRLDVMHGSPPGVSALTALPLVALGPLLATRLVTDAPKVAIGVCVMALVGLPLVALSQKSIRRLGAIMALVQISLPVAAALAGRSPMTAAAAGGLAIIAIEVASRSVPGMLASAASWEDVSGAGRLMPWRCGLLIFAFAVACGLPPTAGFGLRVALARGLMTGGDSAVGGGGGTILALALVASAPLLALPVIRLALFLFGKSPRLITAPPPRPVAVSAMVLAIAVGLAWPLVTLLTT